MDNIVEDWELEEFGCPECKGKVASEPECPGYPMSDDRIWCCVPPCGNTTVYYCVGENVNEEGKDGCNWWWSKYWNRGNNYGTEMGQSPYKEVDSG